MTTKKMDQSADVYAVNEDGVTMQDFIVCGILGIERLPEECHVEFKNGDTLDNRRSNLMVVFEEEPDAHYGHGLCTLTPEQKQMLVELDAMRTPTNRQALAKGWMPDSGISCIFLSDLTTDEAEMTDAQFAKHIDSAMPKEPSAYLEPITDEMQAAEEALAPVKARRRSKETKCVCETCNEIFVALKRNAKKCPKCKGQKATVVEGIKYCGLGKQCLLFDHRKAGIVTGNSDYCSRNCTMTAAALAKRAKTAQMAVATVSD